MPLVWKVMNGLFDFWCNELIRLIKINMCANIKFRIQTPVLSVQVKNQQLCKKGSSVDLWPLDECEVE